LKILIDIGHPAHVHYFRNFIFEMQQKGHSFLITARDKEVTHDLLNRYAIPYINRGKGGKGLVGKLLYILKADWFIYRQARKFKPDLFLSFASTYAAHAAFLSGKPHIALDDTEHAKFELMLYTPFTKVILSPACFIGSLGEKQIRIPSFVEFLYLHRKRFTPNQDIRFELGMKPDQKLVLLRFISWSASHDIGQKGIPDSEKIKLVGKFRDLGYAVKISAEGALLPELEPYRLNTASHRIHDVLAEADLFIGESGTMSTEACVLGTPAFFINSLDAGVFREEVQRGLLWHFTSGFDVTNAILSCIHETDFELKHRMAVQKLHAEKIDFTGLLLWFIETFPASIRELKTNNSLFKRFLIA
jgi:predicted glycosyltransferase